MSLIIQQNEKKEQNVFCVLSARVVVQRVHCNMDEAVVPESFGDRAIGICGDMAKAITDLKGMIT